jgi:anthranilate phosphoribosyltransferase
MTDQASEAQISGLLVALRTKGESVDEIVGFAQTMRRHALHVRTDDPDAIDMCGTGGDGLGTFNISTVASLVAAGAGATVAKHGNRSVSSSSGSADVLAALGVNIQIPVDRVEACVNTAGFGFLFAPFFHPAMKSVAKTRNDLGVRTIFNILGPITNPASVKRQLVGTYSDRVASRLAESLDKLETGISCVIHSENGMDEVSLSGKTRVLEVGQNPRMKSYSVGADHFRLENIDGASLRGGTSQENAAITLEILKGERSRKRDVVVANSALGLYVAGKAATLDEGARMAEEAIDSGRALRVLEKVVELTNRP